jgi:hypothetical protein
MPIYSTIADAIYSVLLAKSLDNTIISQEIPNVMERKDLHSTHGNASLEPILSQKNNLRPSLFTEILIFIRPSDIMV